MNLNVKSNATRMQVAASRRATGVDHALESIHNMKEAFPELWEANEKPESVECSWKVSIETSLIA